MQRVKTGDEVEIIAGKDKGQRGNVLAVFPKENRVTVQNLNMLKKHEKARQAGARQVAAQIVDFEGKMDLSNVMPVCPKCDKAVRVGFRVRESDGFKVRVCRNCGADIE
jgi:large subunit ribosomal protein L24